MEKLVRDFIPQLALNQGQLPMTIRLATLDEMPDLLTAKLQEETSEVAAADVDGVLEELADVLEVVRTLAAVHGCNSDDLDKIAQAKKLARGGFRDGLVWTIESSQQTTLGSAEESLRVHARSALKTAKISQAEACRQLGLSTKHMSRMLAGKAPLSLDWAEKIIDLCGLQFVITVDAKHETD